MARALGGDVRAGRDNRGTERDILDRRHTDPSRAPRIAASRASILEAEGSGRAGPWLRVSRNWGGGDEATRGSVVGAPLALLAVSAVLLGVRVIEREVTQPQTQRATGDDAHHFPAGDPRSHRSAQGIEHGFVHRGAPPALAN